MIYKLAPILEYRLWGGRQLAKSYHLKNNVYGEAWILSCLNNSNSPIAGSKKTLKDLFNKNKNIVKEGYKGKSFPLLVKLIDANDDLSIQVHPDVKTEFWHILNKKASKLYLGFKKDYKKEDIKQILNKGDITKCLNHINVINGDSYLINPGTIHAIGSNTFLIEIQRSADVTYRLYDFHRKDKNGKERELHIKDALKVINYKKAKLHKSKKNGLLVSCPYFKVYKYKVNKSKTDFAKKNSFHFLTVVEGKVKVNNINLNQYESVFIPASEGKYLVKGNATIVKTTL